MKEALHEFPNARSSAPSRSTFESDPTPKPAALTPGTPALEKGPSAQVRPVIGTQPQDGARCAIHATLAYRCRVELHQAPVFIHRLILQQPSMGGDRKRRRSPRLPSSAGDVNVITPHLRQLNDGGEFFGSDGAQGWGDTPPWSHRRSL